MSLQQTTQTTPPPDVVDFGLGQPGLNLLPLQLLKEAAAARFAQGDPSFLQYGLEQGDGYFRTALSGFLCRAYGIPVSPEQLFVTSGASQTLDWLSTLYTQPGDTIFVEEPTYMYVFRIFSDHGLNIISIPTDEHGLVVEALADELKRRRPAFLYTIPTFQNPTGTTLPSRRREQLAELSREHDLLVIADEVYHCLYFDVPPPFPIAAFSAGSNVVSLGSFSKILAPGLRLGWLHGPPAILQRLALTGVVDSGGGLNPFTSAVVRTVLEEGRLQSHVDRLRLTYRARAQALSAALHHDLHEWVTFRDPEGGLFFWLKLKEEIDALALLNECEKFKVAFQPGVRCSSRRAQRNYMRLSFAHYDVPLLVDGVARLHETLKAHG